MKRHWLIASIVALLAIGPVLADPLPINPLPMYGEREKNDAMENADAAFIASIEKQGLSHNEYDQTSITVLGSPELERKVISRSADKVDKYI